METEARNHSSSALPRHRRSNWITLCALFVTSGSGLVQFNQINAPPAPAYQFGRSSARVEPEDGALALLANDELAVQPPAIDQILAQQQKLVETEGAASDQFGNSIAVSGKTAVIAAPSDDVSGVDQGSVFVFTRNGTTWSQQQKLVANDGAAGDQFGVSVAISDDTIVVGAPVDDIGGNTNQGSAYVFTRNGTTWTQQQKLTSADGAAGDLFGLSVAVSGDTVVVTAFADKIAGNSNQGSAYVFTRSGSAWTQQQKLTADDGEPGDFFGRSVASNGDTVVVGAITDKIGANFDQGSAYVFTRSGTTWAQQQKLVADDGADGDHFGLSVALGGETLVVGAPDDDVGGNFDPGSAYVFIRHGANWTQQQKLIADDGALVDFFGVSAALSGDTVVIGALGDDIGGNADQGSAYVFTRSGTVWTQRQKLIVDDGAALDHFGSTVAVSGDTVVVGAPADDIEANRDQGSAYIFVNPACPAVTLDPESLPDGVIGNPYTQIVTAGSDAGLHQFSLSDGALPPGLSLAQTGELSGTPTTAGTYRFTITATILISLCSGSRSYTLTIGSSACQFSIAPINHAFPSGGGNGEVGVNTSDGCGWTAVSNDPMITITSGANGSGNGTVRFAVANNPNPGSRRGSLTVAGSEVAVVQATPVACVSAASFIGDSLATESIVAAFGSGLAQSIEAAATQPLPMTLAGTMVSVRDSSGTERLAPLFFVSPEQINFQVPPGTAVGTALLMIIHDGETVAAASQQIELVSPGLFSANASGEGLLAGVALRVKADGSQGFEPVVRFDEEKQQFLAVPINLDSATDDVFLILFGTGLRNRSALGAVSVKIGGVNMEALYAGPQGSFVGLDQLNVPLPRSLAGLGEAVVNVTVNGVAANNLKVAIR